MYKVLTVVWVVLFASSNCAIAEDNGLLTFKSEYSAAQTVLRLKATLEQKQFKIFNHISHSAGAKANNIPLRDTQLIIFGNPKIGSRLMQCNQSIAIDLPQKALIWNDIDGTTWLTFNSPSYLLRRHDLKECQQLIPKITNALTKIAKNVTQKGNK